MKKTFAVVCAALLVFATLMGCSAAPSGTDAAAKNGSAIAVISREDGSGTRGAFIELFGIEQKDAEGNKVDYTTDNADITNSTSVMMTSVAGNPNAIGYISLGSLNSSVKALEIDGAAATVENIKSGAYGIARPFNVASAADVSEAAAAFLGFILSSEGQQVVADSGYIPLDDTAPFSGSTVSGKVVVAGSSSVTPVMEKLKEAYLALNPNAEIEIQMSDSSTGVKSAIDGICDIGMASRQLKDSELQAGLTSTVIAMDGIAVIVNRENPVSGLTTEQVRAIFMGEITAWDALAE